MDELLKIVVLGAKGVGKSALTVRFLTKRFIYDYAPDTEAAYCKQVDDEDCYVIIDTAGKGCSEETLLLADGFLLVYSMTDSDSFHQLKSFRNDIISVKGSTTVPMVLVANKSDLTQARQVSTNDAKDIALSWGVPFFEVSAAEDIRLVNAAFNKVVEDVLKPYLKARKRSLKENKNVTLVLNKVMNLAKEKSSRTKRGRSRKTM